MDGIRRAEQLIAGMRWLAFVVGALLLEELPPPGIGVALVAGCALYNGAVGYVAARRELFARFGRAMRWAAMALDTLLITSAVAFTASNNGSAYLLYVFVLVSASFSAATAFAVGAAAGAVLSGNFVAGYIAYGPAVFSGEHLRHLTVTSLVLAAGVLGALWLARSRNRSESTVHQSNRLKALFECSGHLTDTRDVHEMAMRALKAAVSQTGAGGGEILLRDSETRELRSEAALVDIKLSADEEAQVGSACATASAWVSESGRALLTQPGARSGDQDVQQTSVSTASAPLVWTSDRGGPEDVIGVILVWHIPGHVFSKDDLELVQALAALASVGIVNLRLYKDLQTAFFRTLQSLAKSLEARDEYTQGHSDRVTQVACVLAKRMSVDNAGIEILRRAGPLHDLGKVGVPDAILRKTGKLTAEEWELMRKHPIIAEEICRPLGLPDEVRFLVKHHHERLDGKGYPSGLPGDEQPLLLRILAVADCFDALRSRRPYREPMTRSELIIEFNRLAGRLFDPTVVEALKGLIEGGELDDIYAAMDAEIGLDAKPEFSLAAAA